MRVVDWEQAGVDHWLRITVAFERLGSRIYGGGDGVAHLGLADVLRSGDHIADLSCAKRLGGHHVGADHADFDGVMRHADTHHVQFLARFQFTVDHTNVSDDATIGVVYGVENERAGRRVRVARRRGHFGDDTVEQFGDAFSGFAGDAQHVGRVTTNQAGDFLGMLVGFGAGQVDFVEHGDNGQIMVDGHIQVGQRLRFNALRGVDKQHRTLACGQRSGHLVCEVHMAGGINHAECVFGAVNRPRHAHGLRFDGDAAFLLDIHAVEEAIAHLALRHDATQLQNTVRHR